MWLFITLLHCLRTKTMKLCNKWFNIIVNIYRLYGKNIYIGYIGTARMYERMNIFQFMLHKLSLDILLYIDYHVRTMHDM